MKTAIALAQTSFFLIIGIRTGSAQTFHLTQLPQNGSVVELTSQPVASYGLTASGDELSFTRLRWGLYPLWPLTTEDIGEITVRGARGVLTGTSTRASSTALPNFPALQFTLAPANFGIADRGSETVSFSIASKQGRPAGIVIIKLEEVVAVGARTKVTVGLIDGDSYHVGVRFPESRLALEATPRRTAPAEPIRKMLLRWSAEPGKSYRIETSADLQEWRTAADAIVGADGEIRFTVSVSPYKRAEFFRLAVMPMAALAATTPPLQTPPASVVPNPTTVPTTAVSPPTATAPPPSANSPPYNLVYPTPKIRW